MGEVHIGELEERQKEREKTGVSLILCDGLPRMPARETLDTQPSGPSVAGVGLEKKQEIETMTDITLVHPSQPPFSFVLLSQKP